MKLEIEITEDEIKSAVERKVRTAIADQTNQWGTDRYIKDAVSSKWKEVVDQMVLDCLQNSEQMKTKILTQIEAKLRGQLNSMMKVKK